MKLVIKTARNADGNFRVWAPALPGCSACGDSEEKARKGLEEVITGYLASLDAPVDVTLEKDLVWA